MESDRWAALPIAVWDLWLLCLATASFAFAQQETYDFSIRIDCGGSQNFTNQFNQTWIADSFYTGGSSAEVSEPNNFHSLQERTLRFFPVTQGKKNCYIVNVPNGRYYIRMFFVYDNYDNKRHPPSFDVSVEGTVVFSWRSDSWTDNNVRSGAYSDIIAFVDDGDATVCLYSIATDSSIIAALEIVQVDPECYSSQDTGTAVVLVNYGRFTGGNDYFGTGVSNDTDRAGRAWEPDTNYSYSSASKVVLSAKELIQGADRPHNYFPTRLYQTAHSLSYMDTLEYLLPVDPSLDYMLWFHFAEIDSRINGQRQRIFDITVNDKVVFSNVDIFREVGKFTAYDLQYIARNLTNSTISIKLVPTIGSPVICGIENYALLPRDLSTDPTEVTAMRALKASLRIPERMGWNGDPCAPSNWDAWEGVGCYLRSDNKALVITHLDLSNQGLKGSISTEVTLLTHLQSLNLSNNILQGSIPSGLGQNALMSLDLSSNELSGGIPTTLGSQQLTTVLLDQNQLRGLVPESLYSTGVHGGYVNLSDNNGLCGVPSLPDCSMFWDQGHLSKGARVGIGFGASFGVVLLLSAVYFIKKWRERDDYNFGLPHELASRSTRYQKQKSKLRIDADDIQLMRSLPVKFGFTSNLNPL
eukprot:c24008_g1_i1 orf=962-2881(-)